MRKSIFFSLLVICSLITLFLTGCASSYLVTKNGDGDDKMNYKEFNREVKGENVTLEFTKGSESYGWYMRVDTDSARWNDYDLQERRCVQLGLLKTVIRKNRFLGGIKGFGLGLLSGAALGLLGASLFGGEWSSDHGGPPPWAVGPVLGALVGGIAGAIIGAITGHKYEYRFVRK
jgi:hypothetical protein